jgi:hypothetical protein
MYSNIVPFIAHIELKCIIHYKNATFYIMHFHVLGIRPEHNFHLSPGNTKESGSLCYGGTC